MFRHLLILSFLCLTLGASGQSSNSFPLRFDGTMMPYDFARADSVSPWPDSMQPVFVVYVARHGARYLSSEKKVSDLENILHSARANGNLSAKGERMLSLMAQVRKVTDRRWGALSEVGASEEVRLGREMCELLPSLMKTGRIEAEATYVPRVVMTMYDFCHQLACNSSHIEISTSEGAQYNPLLRYFTTDTAYVAYLASGPWKKEYDRYASEETPESPAASFFSTPAPFSHEELRHCSLDAYGILQSLHAAGISADPRIWFTEEEYEACWKVTNLEHYYQRSVSRFSDLPARCARPLLDSITADLDHALKSNDVKTPLRARLYFCHAETIIPLFALMRLPGCYAPDLASVEVAGKWKDWEVAPLGANLLIVALRDQTTGQPYVAMRLNGQWTGHLMTIDEFRAISCQDGGC